MIEPTGYTALDLIGFTDKGSYDPNANYVKNDLVHVGNSTWRCKIDDTTGITPTEGANWTIFIESATSLAGMSDVDLNTPKAGDGLVHDGNDWTNIPIMTKEQWKKNGAYNLYSHNLQTQVVNTGGGSVTVTVNRTVGSADYGTFSIVGTVGSATDIVVGALDSNVFKAGQKYKLTGCPSGGGANTYNIRITGAGVEDHGDGVEFTATGSDQMKIQLRGASINATFKPMITTDLNATYSDYQPYAKTNRELTEDWNTVIGPLSFTYSNNLTSSDVVIYAYRYGKIVVISFICPNKNLLPAAAWGTLAIANGFPKPVSDGGNYTQAVHGRTVTNNSPYIFTMTSTGAFMLRKQDNSTSSDSMQAYEGGIIVYLTTD